MLHLRFICPNEYEQLLEYLILQLLLSHISSPVYVLFYSENLCAVYQQVFRFAQVSANAAKFYLIVED